jgi:iron complex transport system ATP-binding protein
MLVVDNLSTGFPQNGVTLHQHLFAEFPTGSLVLLIGPNGVGKSVLLKTLCGLHKPVGGRVIVNQRDVNQITPEERASLTSILLATPPSIDQMSVFDVVVSGRQRFLSGWQNPSSTDLQFVHQSIEKTGIATFANTPFGSLSDGVKQKVMLARCLSQDSQLILLDEPLAFLDYPSRLQFLTLLESLAASENKIILYSSHDLQLSLNHCNRVMALTHNQCKVFQSPQAVNLSEIFENHG